MGYYVPLFIFLGVLLYAFVEVRWIAAVCLFYVLLRRMWWR